MKRRSSTLRRHVSNAIHDAAGDYATAFTIPLCAERGEHREVVGSGLLLRVFDEYFIATAGHVVERMRRASKGDSLWGWSRAASRLFGLEGVTFAARDDARGDVGVIGLPYALACVLGDPANYLSLEDLDAEEVPNRRRWYLVGGFPTALYFHEGSKARIVRYLTHGRDDKCRRDYDPAVDVILNYRPGPLMLNGTDVRDVSPKGMSGGGIWRVFQPKSRRPWTRRDVRLIGIQHSWGAQLLRGTRIACFLRLLEETSPRLGDLIRQHHPGALEGAP